MRLAGARLSDLLDGAAVAPLDTLEVDPEIRGVQLDSRRIGEGDLFFALAGEHVDGERFVPQAVERGARAIVAASSRPTGLDPAVAWVRVDEPRRVTGPISKEFYGRPDEALTLVGITGTNGKTTVSYMVQSIAQAAGRRAGRIGTTGFAFGGLAESLERTTPEATDLFRILDTMRRAGAEVVAMEVSSHALSLDRVCGTRFAVSAFLNLTRDHLDYYESEEAYFEAKARLFETLGPRDRAVISADSPWGDRVARRTRAQALRFGRAQSADVRLSDEVCRLGGSTATLTGPDGPFEIELGLPGKFNLDNAAAAAACAVCLGYDPSSIATGLRNLSGVPGRVERVERGQPFAVWVDYAHTPDALERVLKLARSLARGRVLAVYGCGGDRDRGKRAEMGRVAAEQADISFITSDNPRGEDPRKIVDEVRAGAALVSGAEIRCEVDRREAIRVAIAEAADDDLIVIAGKGHETTQTTGARVERFDDRKVAAELLEATRGGAHA
ncbi:MAG: UDP-N-acetylmuramoyl-L-alanyl-D-glutamate--2,6-diaminopimelate ligase [Acidobacteria bacterium]|nr:UDP-N-acetylmuramoyl-L-alanyl-D-glutamate--2,6-diaminopimelate ligase [Acidobacteriota bacterium]NIM60255.1 UDP-N-acetylmuramoyl-L-alanyl-D-glutamate--2,6-diaminopimelate ligase [Acidobacteriota bacterium]NIO60293.1 UDP-N-acetylmuramoyl-L-alanyl-D-glutamate--2,6-diaminopimelate ligase [Acidobacteriota bacterium]NIQ31348.1 UDP-N-acetylmuramoyl-L-alanyl-D-glutamate--2,6-diaminopimelate ligase [Acidobacteriota bacterium]NIQ86571.1 UDP-N-acetylmuramoyl-L-alanyl-D-glutamate--2,6-diaminopimelate l